MKRVSVVIAISVQFLMPLHAQNVGIGSTFPTRGKLEVGTTSSANQSTAIFGVGKAGVSLQQNMPGIGFNQYLDAGSSFQPRWMVNGYAMKQVFDPAAGILKMVSIRSGIAENIILPADEKLSWQLSYTAINSNGGLGINTAPQTVFHILYKDPSSAATGAGFNPYGIAGFESNIDAFVNLMSPTGYQNGILLGSGLSSIRGGLIYTHSAQLANESLALRTGGNINRLVISGTGNVALGDFQAQNKLEVDGAMALVGATVNYHDVVVWPSATLMIGNRSYFKMANDDVNGNDVAIHHFEPGKKIGQVLIIEKFGGTHTISVDDFIAGTNIKLPGTVFTMGDYDNCMFIWDGAYWVMVSKLNND